MVELRVIMEAIGNCRSFKEIEAKVFAPPEQWAESIAKDHLGKDMKTTQLRKVFTSIKQMELKSKGKRDDEAFNDPSLYMMIPHLAYAKARGFIKDGFYNLIKTVIGDGNNSKIQSVGDFKRFAEFMTAIVAYHKQYSK